MTSAMILEPPSPAKAALIRRFLAASGVASQIETGAFLHRFAHPGGSTLLTEAMIKGRAGLLAGLDALAKAYAPHCETWRREYEHHVNWEFTEAELETLVAFLESDVGQHFLEGRWRMDAYIQTNTEWLRDQIIQEAADTLLRAKPASGT